MKKSWIFLIAIVLIGLVAVKLRRAPSGLRLNIRPLPADPDPALAKNTLLKECRQALTSQVGAEHTGAFSFRDSEPAKDLLIRSFYCEALAKRDPGVCSEFDEIRRTIMGPSESDCRANYFMNMTRFFGAGGRREEAVASCEKHLAAYQKFRKSALREVCLKVITVYERRSRGNICEHAAATLKPGASAKEFRQSCRESFRGLEGPGECAKIPVEDLRARTACFDVSTILAASAAQDPSLCHGSELCEALMTSSTAVCRPLREKAVDMACSAAVQIEMRTRFLAQAAANP